MAKCKVHPGVKLVVFCPACRGAKRTKKKSKSSASNGKLGGRPTNDKRKKVLGDRIFRLNRKAQLKGLSDAEKATLDGYKRDLAALKKA